MYINPPLTHPEDDKYKLVETSSMSGPFSGPPSLSQERIHGVTANLSHKIDLISFVGHPAYQDESEEVISFSV